MNGGEENTRPRSPVDELERYYRFHSRIYDATRWSFLFDRRALIGRIAETVSPDNMLEIGAGTGKNLIELCRTFPDARIAGLDVSADMLELARHKLGALNSRVELLHQAYGDPLRRERPFDLILFSYSLSMINPGWIHAIDSAYHDLAPGGHIAVVDFHDSALPLFKRWMGVNHVHMNGHLLPRLESRFTVCHRQVRRAYLGLWSYMTFIGRK